MKKLAEGYYQFEEMRDLTENVRLEMKVDLIDGQELDAEVKMVGTFWISGKFRKEFANKLGALIDQYRI